MKLIHYSAVLLCITLSVCAIIATCTYHKSVTHPKVKCISEYGEYSMFVENQAQAAVIASKFHNNVMFEYNLYSVISSPTELWREEYEEWKEDRKKYTE